MAMYESEHTKFIREWMQAHPEELKEQQQGRALWWDKPARSLDEMQSLAETKVPQKSYYYDAN